MYIQGNAHILSVQQSEFSQTKHIHVTDTQIKNKNPASNPETPHLPSSHYPHDNEDADF